MNFTSIEKKVKFIKDRKRLRNPHGLEETRDVTNDALWRPGTERNISGTTGEV